MSKLFVTWKKCIKKLLNLNVRTPSVYIPLIIDDMPFEHQLAKRFVKFYNNIINSDNNVIKLCAKFAYNGSNSNVCQNYNDVRFKYNITENRWCNICYSCIYKENESDKSTLVNVANIKDLLILKGDSDTFFTSVEIQYLIDHFCNINY
jgi:hypothetical protein